jgi:hypothetical protein
VRTHASSALRRLHEMQAVEQQLADLRMHTLITPAVLARYRRTLALLGPAAQNPPLPEGGTVYDAVLPWLLAAERADVAAHSSGSESSDSLPNLQGTA